MRLPRFPIAFTFFALIVIFAGAVYMARGPLAECRAEHGMLENQLASEDARTCHKSGDCTVFSRTCGIFSTCGIAMNHSVLQGAEKQVQTFETNCAALTLRCLSCKPVEASCQNGLCVVVQKE